MAKRRSRKSVFSFRNFQLPRNVELRASLGRIYGVGKYRADLVAAKLGISYPFSASKLNNYYYNILTNFLNKMLLSKAKIERAIEMRIKLFKSNLSYKGLRHKLFLPVRGQRTRTNARTIKRMRIKK